MLKKDLAQIAQCLGCNVKVSGVIRGFKQDSREVLPGDLFFAMQGERVDGHRYLEEIAAKGAIAAVVSKEYRGEGFGLQLLPVDDVLTSLQMLAKVVHASRNARVVAVTGSVGKTTTKEFIATLLEGKFRVGKTPGNANSQVGVPLSILNYQGDGEVFVVEMGMTGFHQIEKLIAITPPEISVITKIALAHAGFFANGIEGISEAKAEILSHPLTQTGILNYQVTQYPSSKTGSCQKMTYGLEEEGRQCDFLLCAQGGNFYVKEGNERSPEFSLPFAALHLCENFMGAVAVARKMGMQWEEIISQIPKLATFKQRFEKVEQKGIVFINDSYNSSEDSVRAALVSLPIPKAGRKKIAVLGTMPDLGVFSDASHEKVATIALDYVDHLLCLGEECKPMVDVFNKASRPVEYFDQLGAIKQRVFELAQEGDVVLIKGANTKKMWLILESE